MKKKLLSFAMITILALSCTNNSEDDLIIKETTIETKTYANSVKSIIDAKCINCHASTPIFGAPMPLITYNQVKDAVLNRGLLNRIELPNGAPGLMPTGGPRMPQQTIDVVIKWNTDGLLEQ
jgi:uncharacterized membrane protein